VSWLVGDDVSSAEVTGEILFHTNYFIWLAHVERVLGVYSIG
jgi:hypothetical protein